MSSVTCWRSTGTAVSLHERHRISSSLSPSVECNVFDNLVFVNRSGNRLSLSLLVKYVHTIKVEYRSLECRDGHIGSAVQRSYYNFVTTTVLNRLLCVLCHLC